MKLSKTFPKPTTVVMARSDGAEFTLLDRKVFNVLYANAYHKLRNNSPDRSYQINLNDLKLIVLSPHDDMKLLRDSLDRLWSVKIAVDYVDENKIGNTLRCHYLSWSLTEIDGPILTYAFDEMLMRFMMFKEVYALIELQTAQSMKTRYGLRLYEALTGVVRLYHQKWDLTIEDLRTFFELDADKHTRQDHLKKNVIEKAMDDVNRHAPFSVRAEYRRSGKGGRIIGVTFYPEMKKLLDINNSEPIKLKDDRSTIDIFDNVTEEDRLVPPQLRADTFHEAQAMLVNENPYALVDEWFHAYGARVHNNPDEMFLSWIRMRVKKNETESLEGVDLDSFLGRIMQDDQ